MSTTRAVGNLVRCPGESLSPAGSLFTSLPARAIAPRLPATMWRHLKNFLLFLCEEKAWWLVPLVVIFLLLAGVLVFNGSSVLAPLMYPVR